MTILAFKPKGDVAEWQMVYDDLLVTAEFGQVITYEQLDEALGRRFLDSRSPIYKARTHLGEMRSRWLESVPSEGYRAMKTYPSPRLNRSNSSPPRLVSATRSSCLSFSIWAISSSL